jgi:hypothetical protein
MEQCAGLDVSLEATNVCVVDGAGRVVREARLHAVERLRQWAGRACDIEAVLSEGMAAGLEVRPAVRRWKKGY